jgi:hypothetical protein
MKGPYERLKYDLRRLWECPACKRRERTAGSITFRHCSCRLKQLDGKPVVMQLVEDDIQRLVPAVAIDHPPLQPPPQEPVPLEPEPARANDVSQGLQPLGDDAPP